MKIELNLICDAHLSLHAQLIFQLSNLKFELRSTSGKFELGLLLSCQLRFLQSKTDFVVRFNWGKYKASLWTNSIRVKVKKLFILPPKRTFLIVLNLNFLFQKNNNVVKSLQPQASLIWAFCLEANKRSTTSLASFQGWVDKWGQDVRGNRGLFYQYCAKIRP